MIMDHPAEGRAIMTPTNQATLESIIGRRTAHDYTGERVDDELVENALLAANHAPNHKHTFPWRFTILGPAARQEVAELGVTTKAAGNELTEQQQERTRNRWLSPSHMIVITQVRCDDPDRNREDYAACACAIQNMMVYLASVGVHSKWSTGGLSKRPEIHGIAGIDKNIEQVIGFVLVGIASGLPNVSRPELESVVRRTP